MLSVPNSLRQHVLSAQSARHAGEWAKCEGELQALSQQLATRKPGWEDNIRAAALHGMWGELLAVIHAAGTTVAVPWAVACTELALSCTQHLMKGGRPLPAELAQEALSCAILCLVHQDAVAAAAGGSCASGVAGGAAALAAFALNTAEAQLSVPSASSASLAQLCVQGYAAHCGVSVPPPEPKLTAGGQLAVLSAPSAPVAAADGPTAPAASVMFSAADTVCIQAGDTNAPAFVRLLLGLVRSSDVQLQLLLRAGAVQVLLHAAHQNEADHETAVAALGALRSVVQLAVPRHPQAPAIAREHRQRLLRQVEAEHGKDTNELVLYFLQANMPQQIADLAQRHPNVWVRRAAAECLETLLYHPRLAGGRGAEAPPQPRAGAGAVVCSAAPCRPASVQHSLSWYEWATGTGQRCVAIEAGHPTGSLTAQPPPAELRPLDGQYCADVLQAAADADWLSSKWAKRGVAFGRSHGGQDSAALQK